MAFKKLDSDVLGKLYTLKMQGAKSATLQTIGFEGNQWNDITIPNDEDGTLTKKVSFHGKCSCGKVISVKTIALVDTDGKPKCGCLCLTYTSFIVSEYTGRLDMGILYDESVRLYGREATNKKWMPMLKKIPNFPCAESVTESTDPDAYLDKLYLLKNELSKKNDCELGVSITGFHRLYHRTKSKQTDKLGEGRLGNWFGLYKFLAHMSPTFEETTETLKLNSLNKAPKLVSLRASKNVVIEEVCGMMHYTDEYGDRISINMTDYKDTEIVLVNDKNYVVIAEGTLSEVNALFPQLTPRRLLISLLEEDNPPFKHSATRYAVLPKNHKHIVIRKETDYILGRNERAKKKVDEYAD